MQPSQPPYTPVTFTPIPQDDPTPPAPKNRRGSGVISTIFVIISAIAVALLLVTFVFRPYVVDGPSMEPSLQNNDRLIIWKIPRTWAMLTNSDYIPNRGDVIVFTERGLVSGNGSSEEQLIKRVIGVPGDTVVIENGIVTVYNEENPDGFQPDTTMPYGEGIDLTVNENETVNMTIQEGEIYVMGDNRDNSRDSRMFGAVSADDIVGKLVLRIFPIDQVKVF